MSAPQETMSFHFFVNFIIYFIDNNVLINTHYDYLIWNLLYETGQSFLFTQLSTVFTIIYYEKLSSSTLLNSIT